MRVCRQALGVLFTLGTRTVARVLAATGRDQCDWSTEYRIFSRSPWTSRELFAPIIKTTLNHCSAQGPIILAGDFTHLRKSGKHIPGVTCMRDPLPARSIPVRFEASPVVSRPGKRAGEGSRCYYDKQTFTPESIRQDETKPWESDQFFHAGRFHTIRFKEDADVLWRTGAKRRRLRLIVIAPTGYRLHLKGRLLYRQPAYFLTDDLETTAQELIAAYLEHWQIEVNHREEKDTMGVGDAQVRNEESVFRQPAFAVAIYALLLLAALKAYGPERTADYLPPPKWGRPSKRPSCLDILALLRHQITAHPEKLVDFDMETSALQMVLKATA